MTGGLAGESVPLGRPSQPSSGSRVWKGLRKNSAGSDVQDGRQFSDDLQPDVSHRPLCPAQVGAVDLGVVGQLLVGQLPLVPDKVNPKLACTRQPTCGLSARGGGWLGDAIFDRIDE
jgi:hypothetical protein